MKYTLTGVGRNSIEKAETLLRGVPGGVEKAVRGALPRFASELKKEAAAAVGERYDLSAANIRKYLSASRKTSGKTAEVRFKGNRVPLFAFGGASPRNPLYDETRRVPVMTGGGFKLMHPGKPAYGHQLAGTSPAEFDDAFVAAMASGHVGIFERTGGAAKNGGDEIREVMGLSIPEMIGSFKVSGETARKAADLFEAELDKQITRIMSGVF